MFGYGRVNVMVFMSAYTAAMFFSAIVFANGHIHMTHGSEVGAEVSAKPRRLQEVCTTPSTVGYDFSGANASVPRDSFDASAVASSISCAAGYQGIATASVCGAAGSDYGVSGCEESSCSGITAPLNGGMGKCATTLAAQASCQPTCDYGYTVNGASSCAKGRLTAAICQADDCWWIFTYCFSTWGAIACLCLIPLICFGGLYAAYTIQQMQMKQAFKNARTLERRALAEDKLGTKSTKSEALGKIETCKATEPIKLGLKVCAVKDYTCEGFYKQGDTGVITEVDDGRFSVTWTKTSKISTMDNIVWMDWVAPMPQCERVSVVQLASAETDVAKSHSTAV